MILTNWLKGIFKVFGIQVQQLYYFEKDLIDAIIPVTPSLPLDIRKAGKEDINTLLNLVSKDSRQRIKRYQKYSSVCYIAWYKDQFAGYTWLNTKRILLNGYNIGSLGPGGAFAFGGYVFPEFRGKKVFTALIATYYSEMREQGYKFVGNITSVHNRPAIRARERFSAKRKRIYIMLLPFGLHILLGGPIGKGKLINAIAL